MIDILKRIFIGVVIGMSIFFLKSFVFAAEIPGRYVGQEQFFASPVSGSYAINSTSTVPYSYNFNASIIPNGTTIFESYRDGFNNDPLYDNGVFLIFRIETTLTNIQSNNTSSNELDIPLYNFSVVLVSNGLWSTCYISNNSAICPISANTGQFTQLRVYQTDSSSYISSFGNARLNIRINNYADIFVVDNDKSLLYGIVNWLNRIYQNMSSTAIQQQTQDILDSDASASATYNNDYSTTAYDSAEASMNQNLDQDVSGFNFNPLDWSRSFSFIWGTVTDLVQINSKVFLMITTFLTFSFVGLVIGRS